MKQVQGAADIAANGTTVILALIAGAGKNKGEKKMGFKCPFCKKDFGQDKREFDLHIKSHDEPIPDLAGLVYINSTDSVKNILEKDIKK